MENAWLKWLGVFALGATVGGAALYLFGIDSRPPAETDPAVFMVPAAPDAAAPAGTPRYSLREAAERGLVQYEVAGRGASSGPALVLGIQRLSDAEFDVYVAPGTVFMPGGGDVQRMVAWGVIGVIGADGTVQPATSVYLPTQEVKLVLLEAYCLDFELENPAVEHRFQAVAAPAVRAAQLIYEGKRNGLSTGAIQTAIWVQEDSLERQEIQAKFDATDEEVDDAFELLKRTPPPNG